MNSDCTLRNRKNTHHYKKHYTVEVNTHTHREKVISLLLISQNNNPSFLSYRTSPSPAPAAAPDVPV